MNVMVVKLKYGDEIVSDVVENIDGSVTLKKPVVMQAMPTETGGMRIDMIPYQPFADMESMKKGINIKNENILFMVPAAQAVARGYTERMSDIKIASPAETAALDKMKSSSPSNGNFKLQIP